MLVLSFLTVVGGALLTTSTIDIWISDNYKHSTQSLYVAEAGIDDAREVLRASGRTLSELLTDAAGPDHFLMTVDDQPLISSRPLIDSSGQAAGFYEVSIRNDYADGASSLVDSNEVVTLVSTGQIGGNRKTIEVTVQKGRFPENDTDPRLQSIAGLEALVASITNNARTIYSGNSVLTGLGAPGDYSVVVVDGNLDLGPGTGYGLLLVRGELTVVADINWNGLILVIGQGVLHWNDGVTGTINGGTFVAKTRGTDGSLLSTPANWMYSMTDASQIKAANRSFPYNSVAIREK
jgi:hypothetical protein